MPYGLGTDQPVIGDWDGDGVVNIGVRRASERKFYLWNGAADTTIVLGNRSDLPVAGGAKPNPLTLPQTTIFLPTRRAARALREAFLAESGGEALLLPRIRALGHADEEAALILDAEALADADGALGAPAIGTLPRLMALMRPILALGRTFAALSATETEIESVRFDCSPGQAASLAAYGEPEGGLGLGLQSIGLGLQAVEANLSLDLYESYQSMAAFIAGRRAGSPARSARAERRPARRPRGRASPTSPRTWP